MKKILAKIKSIKCSRKNGGEKTCILRRLLRFFSEFGRNSNIPKCFQKNELCKRKCVLNKGRGENAQGSD